MTDQSPTPRPCGDERSAGREASRDELARRLVSAPPEFLVGAIDNPDLTRRELLLLLRNRQAPPELLRRVADEVEWMRHHEVQRAVALHPRTPLAVARNLVPHLYWKELAEVAVSPQVNPVARRQAEMRLVAQIEELTEGERLALARRASRTVIGALIAAGTGRELRGLLGNPRMIESDAVRIASRRSVPPGVLAHLADHERWSCRRPVRLALLSNPRTPVPSALRMLRNLSARDLQRLIGDDAVPRIVRVGAERCFKRSAPRGASSFPPRRADV